MAKKKEAKAWTADELHDLIAERFKRPEWLILPEVRNTVGFTSTARYADALALSMYPSRGLRAFGFEIKVSVSDLRKELDSPEKAAAIQQFCNQWWLVVPSADMIPADLLPPAWGVLEVKRKKLSVAKKAQPLKAKDWTQEFVLSLLRSVDVHGTAGIDLRKAKDAHAKGYREGFEFGANSERVNRDQWRKKIGRLEDAIKAFERESGINVCSYSVQSAAEAGKRVRGASSAAVAESLVGRLEKLSLAARNIKARADEEIATVKRLEAKREEEAKSE